MQTTRADYNIIKHETPVLKYGVVWHYKIMFFDPAFDKWIYVSDAVSIQSAEEEIEGMVQISRSNVYKKLLKEYYE